MRFTGSLLPGKSPRPRENFRFLPIKCSTERHQQNFSRQDAKTAKKNIFLFLRTWRPLRLCGSPRGIPTRPRSGYSPEALFHRASYRLSDSLNPNSTENFKYICKHFFRGWRCLSRLRSEPKIEIWQMQRRRCWLNHIGTLPCRRLEHRLSDESRRSSP